MDDITVTLPVPPSTNHLYEPATRYRKDKQTGEVYRYQGKRLKASVAAYRDEVTLDLRRQNVSDIPAGVCPVFVINLYVANDAYDADNAHKCLIDAVAKALHFNDKRIREIHTYKNLDEANPRTELRILWNVRTVLRIHYTGALGHVGAGQRNRGNAGGDR